MNPMKLSAQLTETLGPETRRRSTFRQAAWRRALPARPPRRRSLAAGAYKRPTSVNEVARLDAGVDDKLSNRPLTLDGAGYFLVKLDREANEIVAEHFTNTINKSGLACDPDTGEVIPCTPGYTRPPSNVFRGRTAKEISVKILEQHDGKPVCSRLEHANYLGREFQRAEMALAAQQDYIQD